MERFFNTAGPNRPQEQYTIDPLTRFDLDDMLLLIRQKKYFVLHAPRQTGKTSCMLALRDYLNQHGEYIAVYANVEGGQASRNNVKSVVKSTVDTLSEEARLILRNDIARNVRNSVQDEGEDAMLTTFLRRLSEALDKPLVLIIDEAEHWIRSSMTDCARHLNIWTWLGAWTKATSSSSTVARRKAGRSASGTSPASTRDEQFPFGECRRPISSRITFQRLKAGAHRFSYKKVWLFQNEVVPFSMFHL